MYTLLHTLDTTSTLDTTNSLSNNIAALKELDTYKEGTWISDFLGGQQVSYYLIHFLIFNAYFLINSRDLQYC